MDNHSEGEQVNLTAGFIVTKLPDMPELQAINKGEATVKKELAYGEIEVLVSNSAIDRHGESIRMEGIDISQIKRNPVVLWAHQYDELPIGSITKIWRTSGNLMARIKLAVEMHEFAETVYKMVLAGIINAVSIGGIAKKWNEEYTVIEKLEMIELSIVPVGAHPDALVTAKAIDMNSEDIVKQYRQYVYKETEEKLQLTNDQLKLHVKALDTVTSALRSSVIEDDLADTDDSGDDESKRIRLTTIRSKAKLADKLAELILAEITQKFKILNNKNVRREDTNLRA